MAPLPQAPFTRVSRPFIRLSGRPCPILSHPLFTMPVMNVATDFDFSASAGRLYVDDWSPEYGPSWDAPEERNLAGQVDAAVKPDHWRALSGSTAERFTEVAVVDGVRRVDARLTLMERFKSPLPGWSVAFGTGSAFRRLIRLFVEPLGSCHTPCLLCLL